MNRRSETNYQTGVPFFYHRTVYTVVILLKATKHAEREQINKSHWLNNVSRAHFIGRERFPKRCILVF